MQHKNDKTIFFTGLGIFILFFVVFHFLNRSVENQFKNQISQTPYEKTPALPQGPIMYSYSVEVEDKSVLSPSDPAQYHISEHTKSLMLRNQMYWDSTMNRMLQESDILDRMVETEAFKGVQKTSQQFNKKIIHIDGRIKEYEHRVQGDPGNNDLQQKLQSLYQMKSIADSLEEVVVGH